MRPASRSVLHALATAAGLALSAAAFAQAFPAKPVRILVPFPAAGGADIVARLYAPRLTELWGQQVVVDNRGGAAGTIGTEIAARAPADGHTIFLGTMGTFVVNPSLYAKLPFDIARDFAPLTELVAVHFVLVAHPSLPVRTVGDLVALAKARPGQINFSSSGAGGAPHLAGELLKNLAKIEMTHVPYKGSGPSFADLIGGHVSVTFDSMVQSLPYIKGGRLRALAVLGTKRSPLLPEVPTMIESGIAGYDLTNWFGMAVPAATPAEVVQRIYTDIAKLSRDADLAGRLIGMGAEPIASPPAEFAVRLKTETARWAQVIKQAGIKAE